MYKSQSHLYINDASNVKKCIITDIVGDYDHILFAKKMNWSLQLTYIVEGIYIHLSDGFQFANDILSAPKPGADLTSVPWEFFHQIFLNESQHVLPMIREACVDSLNIIELRSKSESLPKQSVISVHDALANNVISDIRNNHLVLAINALTGYASKSPTDVFDNVNLYHTMIAIGDLGDQKPEKYNEIANTLISIIKRI